VYVRRIWAIPYLKVIAWDTDINLGESDWILSSYLELVSCYFLSVFCVVLETQNLISPWCKPEFFLMIYYLGVVHFLFILFLANYHLICMWQTHDRMMYEKVFTLIIAEWHTYTNVISCCLTFGRSSICIWYDICRGTELMILSSMDVD